MKCCELEKSGQPIYIENSCETFVVMRVEINDTLLSADRFSKNLRQSGWARGYLSERLQRYGSVTLYGLGEC